MLINAIEIYHVAMPLLYPWRTAYGEDAAVESVLVRLRAHEGSGGRELSAWGESSPLAAPCYSPEWAGGVFAVLRDWLAPAVVGRQVASAADLQRLLVHFKGNHFAKGALDTAWWALEAVRLGRPLHRLLGATRDTCPVGADFGIMDSIDDLLRAIAGAVEARFPRIKLKFRPGWDLPMLAAVRREFPDQVFHIDCNSGYHLSDLDLFRRVDELNLAMIEQPLAHDDLVDHAKLQQAIRTPVCLDESITSLERAAQAIELGSCRYVNIKPGRVGGLTSAVAIHDLCRRSGIPCWVGGMLESAVGSRLCVALAMLDNFTYPADIFPSERFYGDDLGRPELKLTPGPDGPPHVAASDAPGIGAEPEGALLHRLSKQKARIEATRR
jgi:O-succinylbenzoate synthase